MKPTPALHSFLLASLALVGSATAATTLLSTNFQGHADGAATDSSLNAITSGGTWTLNTARGATYSVSTDASGVSAGDKALMLDDSSAPAANALFGTLTLNSAADFSTNAATFTTSTISRRSGGSRDLRYVFRDSSNVTIATIDWLANDTVIFNFGTPVAQTFTTLFSDTWDGDDAGIKDITAVFSGSTVTMTFGGVSSGALPLMNSGASNLSVFRVQNNSNPTAAGLFLDDILVTQVPEPSAALLGGLGLLLLLRRRR